MDKENTLDLTNVLPKLTLLSRLTLENENVQRLLNDPKQSFDVVIAQWVLNELYSG